MLQVWLPQRLGNWIVNNRLSMYWRWDTHSHSYVHTNTHQVWELRAMLICTASKLQINFVRDGRITTIFTLYERKIIDMFSPTDACLKFKMLAVRLCLSVKVSVFEWVFCVCNKSDLSCWSFENLSLTLCYPFTVWSLDTQTLHRPNAPLIYYNPLFFSFIAPSFFLSDRQIEFVQAWHGSLWKEMNKVNWMNCSVVVAEMDGTHNVFCF